jgi:hypothetical protein
LLSRPSSDMRKMPQPNSGVDAQISLAHNRSFFREARASSRRCR